jgi:hypothetical protein
MLIGVALQLERADRGRHDVESKADLFGIGLRGLGSGEAQPDLFARIARSGPAGERIGALGLGGFEFENPAIGPITARLHRILGTLIDTSGWHSLTPLS